MILKKNIWVLPAALGLLVSCSRNDGGTEGGTGQKVDEVNDFVWKALNSWYYWQPNVPKLADGFKNSSEYATFLSGKTPDQLFYSLLYEYGTKDRFSWIEKDNTVISPTSRMAEVEKKSGMEVGIYPKGGSSNNYVALVHYVVPGSFAAAAGIKRGDVITKVNGAYLTEANYRTLFTESFSITRAETVNVAVVSGFYQVVTTDKTESLAISETSIDENPIAFYKKFEMGGKNIGYLVYNGFKLDYNDELNSAFAKMKADGINELILDLRYNGGGSLDTAMGLAQMINGSFTGGNYVYMDYNDKHNNYDGYGVLKNKITTYNVVNGHEEKTGEQTVNSLALPKIYALVSFQTASASELTIISLSKYINVTTIGFNTVGKFVGSHTLYDSPAKDYVDYDTRNTTHKWQLQPITFAYYNKNREAHPVGSDGTEQITPQYRISPYQAFNNIKEFGNTSDPELKKALELITGTTLRSSSFLLPELNYNMRLFSEQKNPAKGLYIHDIDEYLNMKTN